MIGAIVGDYFGGSLHALGVQIENSISLFDFPLGWAAIVVASAFGIALLPDGHAGRAIRSSAGSASTRADRFGQNRPKPTTKEGLMKRKYWGALGDRGCGGITTLAALSTTAGASTKLTKVTLQLKWVTQAQFAGYYAAAASRATTRRRAST